MQEIESINELCSAIERDIKDLTSIVGRRFGVRFVLLNTPVELSSCIQTVINHGGSKYSISEISVLNHPNEDKLISFDQVLDFIKEKKEICVVCGVSQFSRHLSNKDFNHFFRSLADYETNSDSIRIYIPLVDIHDRFRRIFWKDYPRNSLERVLPLKVVKQERANRTICLFSSLSFEKKEGVLIIFDYKQWLDIEQRGEYNKLLIKSKPLLASFPDIQHGGGFYRYFFEETYPLMISRLYPSFFSHSWVDESDHCTFWQKLLIHCDFLSNCCTFIKGYFSKYNLTIVDWLELFFKENNNFNKWLLLQYAASCSKEKTYLQLVANIILKGKSNSYSDVTLVSLLYSHIFGLTISEQSFFAKSRKEILLECSNRGFAFDKIDISPDEKHFLSTLFKDDFITFKKLYTGILRFEQEIVLESFKAGLIQQEELLELIPDIRAYVDDSCIKKYEVKQWIMSYFTSYRKAKLKDEVSDELQSYLSSYNSSDSSFWQWFFDLPLTQEQLGGLDDAFVIWVDALGFEWAPFIISRISSHLEGKEIRLVATRCNLPSNTRLNQFSANQKKQELDKLYHDGHYRYPSSILTEIDCVKKISDYISALCEQHERIYVVSDHGATAMSRLTDGLKRFSEAEHDGRYVSIKRDLENDPCGITHVNQQDGKRYLIARTYRSLSARPSREVHGGCTPEEVIVPLIEILPHAIVATTETFDIDILDKSINTLSRSLRFLFKATLLAKVKIQIGNNIKFVDCRPDREMSVSLPTMHAGNQLIKFSVGDKTVEKTINVLTSNIEEEDMGFDD